MISEMLYNTYYMINISRKILHCYRYMVLDFNQKLDVVCSQHPCNPSWPSHSFTSHFGFIERPRMS